MTDIPVDGRVRVDWVSSIANILQPTLAELALAMNLNSHMPKDGLSGWTPDTADVVSTNLDGLVTTNENGMITYSGPLVRLKRQEGTDLRFNTLVFNTRGYIVIRRYMLASTAYAATQVVFVGPVVCSEPREMEPEENSMARFEVPMKITSTPAARAVVQA